MDPIQLVLIIVVTVLLLSSTVGYVVARRRRNDLELEPSPLDPKPAAVAVEERPKADLDDLPPIDDVFVGTKTDEPIAGEVVAEAPVEPAALDELVKPSFFERLGKARSAFTGYLGGLVGLTKVSDDDWEMLEEALIRADVGVSTSMALIQSVKDDAKEAGAEGGAEVLELLKARMLVGLEGKDRSLKLDEGETNVWLFVGVNGVGKTTTIGKVGRRLIDDGRKPLMAAGDTFRAAAAEQLTMWAERAGAEIVRGKEGSDPSSVIFDGVAAAAARGCDVVLADTAGRLHNKSNLMDELSKVRRVASKEPGHVTEVLLVMDATTGQNGMAQAKVFTEAVEVTGVVLTKLDGSAKGGIVFAVESELGIPVKLVGLGEQAGDLVDFEPDEFINALFE